MQKKKQVKDERGKNMSQEKKKTSEAKVENIYRLDGRVPLSKAIPFGLQHVLAMFVANLAPVLIVCSAALVRGRKEPVGCRNHKPVTMCDVCSGNRNVFAIISYLEDWFGTSDRDGSKLYFFR